MTWCRPLRSRPTPFLLSNKNCPDGTVGLLNYDFNDSQGKFGFGVVAALA